MVVAIRLSYEMSEAGTLLWQGSRPARSSEVKNFPRFSTKTHLFNLLLKIVRYVIQVTTYLDDDDAARIANCGTADNLRSAESFMVASIAVATANFTKLIH